MKALDIDYVRNQLKRRSDERQLQRVAKGSGIGLRTITYIIAGRTSCKIDTIHTLQEFLKSTEKKITLKDVGDAR